MVTLSWRRSIPLPAVMQAGGWKSPAMLARYTERLQTGRGAVARVRRRYQAGTPVDDA